MINREEVAKKLRAKYKERTMPGLFEPQDVYFYTLNYLKDLEKCLPDGESAFTVLADLIDPTCKPVEADNNIVCSECGADLYDDDLYCPHCGVLLKLRLVTTYYFEPEICSVEEFETEACVKLSKDEL